MHLYYEIPLFHPDTEIISLCFQIAYIFTGTRTLRSYSTFVLHYLSHFTLTSAIYGTWCASTNTTLTTEDRHLNFQDHGSSPSCAFLLPLYRCSSSIELVLFFFFGNVSFERELFKIRSRSPSTYPFLPCAHCPLSIGTHGIHHDRRFDAGEISINLEQLNNSFSGSLSGLVRRSSAGERRRTRVWSSGSFGTCVSSNHSHRSVPYLVSTQLNSCLGRSCSRPCPYSPESR